MKNKISIEEYRELTKKNNIPNTRKPSSLYKNNERNYLFENAYNTAVETIRNLQSDCSIMLFGRDNVGLKIKIFGAPKGDGSNIFKGIEDGLNKIAYEDDKQVRSGSFKFC